MLKTSIKLNKFDRSNYINFNKIQSFTRSMKIPFNRPYLTGNEIDLINKAILNQKISGNGHFTNICQQFFEKRYGLKKALLTNSCTSALEMAAILINIKPGDEVIIPSYTFVSTANAFVLRGAKIVFCDSKINHPGIDEDKIEALITSKTKAIVPVHYGGVACNMFKIMYVAKKYNLFVIEDAAQAIEGNYTFPNGQIKALGSIGHLATFSFHETKNIISGEGGLLAINDTQFIERSEVIWEKGTNRSAFFRGEVNQYEWVDIGSSYFPSEITAAFLVAQLQSITAIQKKRKKIWDYYLNNLEGSSKFFLTPEIPEYSNNNSHLFYLSFNSNEDRARTIQHLKKNDILAVFHYISLHSSSFYEDKYEGSELDNCNKFSDTLLRLPFYTDITIEEQTKVIEKIKEVN